MRSLRILYIAPYVPSLTRVRPFNLIKQLAARGHRVTLCASAAAGAPDADPAAIAPFCESVEIVPVTRVRSWWNCIRALPTATPLQAVYGYSPRMPARIDDLLARGDGFDVVHVEHLRGALFAWSLTQPRVFDAVDCISQLFAQTADMGAGPSRWMAQLDLPRTRTFERKLIEHFPRTLATSADERVALAGLGGDPREQARAAERITVLSNGVDLDYFAPMPVARDPATLVFVGRMSYHANVAAVEYFVRDILPRVWQVRPQVCFDVVGENPKPSLRRLAAESGGRITVTGTVADVRSYVARATVSVCPITYAVGMQNKVVEAMAMATPTICTPPAARALAATESELLVAPDAPSFAAQILALLDDGPRRERLGSAARQYVERAHDWRRSGELLETIYCEEMAKQGRSNQC